MPDPQSKNPFKRLSRNTVILAFVSMFNDISSESIARILPIFLHETLKASFLSIGWVEGVADSLSILLRLASGWISDFSKRKKPFIVFGYGLSALIRPFFPFFLASFGWMGALCLKAIDRIGKAVRVSPRDALIAQESADNQHGEGFGLNRTLDNIGAFVGIGSAALIIYYQSRISPQATNVLSPSLFKAVVAFASVFGFCAVILILFGIKEETITNTVGTLKNSSWEIRKSFNGLPKSFYTYLGFVCLFNLAGSSDAFLILKLRASGFSLIATLCLIVGYNLISALSAYPISRYSDLLKERKILIGVGWIIYAGAYLLFGFSETPLFLGIGFVAYGLYYGFVESTEKALVADLVPKTHVGRAYGLFNFLTGLMVLPANLIFGFISDHWGMGNAFLLSGGITVVSALFLWFIKI